jgi:predicted DNA-binding WGR domain protein
MRACLIKNGAKDDGSSVTTVQRATSSILNNISFPMTLYDFDEDFEQFNKYVAEEEKKDKSMFEELSRVKPHHLVTGGDYEVIYEGDKPYSTYLVKVEIARGLYSGNTFYRMQLLRDKARGIIVLFTNWGRNGDTGQYQHTPFKTIEEGHQEFVKIFKAKSGNKWENRDNFQRLPKKYRLVTFKEQNRAKEYLKKINFKDPNLVSSTLSPIVFKFMRRVCNSKIVTKNARWLDNRLLPFHNLTKDRLLEASQILNHIKEIIDQIEKKKDQEIKYDPETADLLTDLTNEFYTLIPTTEYKTSSIPPLNQKYLVD